MPAAVADICFAVSSSSYRSSGIDIDVVGVLLLILRELTKMKQMEAIIEKGMEHFAIDIGLMTRLRRDLIIAMLLPTVRYAFLR